MPLVGGGGAPNVSGGANPAGTGSNLNYIGNHVYANSGIIGVDQNTTTMLSFNTGSGYIVAKIQVDNSSGSNDDIKYFIKFNSETISSWYFSTAGNHNEPMNPVYVIIPADTRVEVSAANQQSTSERNHTAIVTGRVYA